MVNDPMSDLFPLLRQPPERDAISIGRTVATYRELAGAAGEAARELAGARRVAIVATPTLATIVGALGALAAGAAIVPLNPSSPQPEIEHILADSCPDAVIDSGAALPPSLSNCRRVRPQPGRADYVDDGADDPERTALILYTSGTTGRPKGVQIPRRAIATNIDALRETWRWSDSDRLAHTLPLFHVHGLVLGIFGPLRIGGYVEHAGSFSPEALAGAAERGATMIFGVPTMYHRIADACEQHEATAAAFARPRVLVSGSAGLPAYEHRRMTILTGQEIVERYGMTETLMNTSVCVDDEHRPGYVGRPLPGVELLLIDDDGNVIESSDDETFGEILIRGANLFNGYLNQDDATAEAMADGWFKTGDLATRAADGYIRIVGRRAADLIKSGGFKIGAGEIEAALLEHPAIAEVAVAGMPDNDLGERVVAWIVARHEQTPTSAELMTHVSTLLASHKRPREFRFVESLPRNALGKVIKKDLVGT